MTSEDEPFLLFYTKERVLRGFGFGVGSGVGSGVGCFDNS